MNKNLPIEYEGSFISKLKRLFYKLFNKKKTEEKVRELKIQSPVAIQNDFEKMKNASKEKTLKDDIFVLAESHPELLDNLPIERLMELDKIYDEKIAENNRKIARLKRALS